MTIDVYEAYFKADALVNGIQRRAVKACLTCVSGEGNVSYDISLAIFPHVDEEDYAVGYDAFLTRNVYQAKGRRSKVREAKILKTFQARCDAMAKEIDANIDWECPLREARTA